MISQLISAIFRRKRAVTSGDPNTVFLLHFDESPNSPIVDSSIYGEGSSYNTRYDAFNTTSSNPKFGNSAAKAWQNSRLLFPSIPRLNFAAGQPWTVEFWYLRKHTTGNLFLFGAFETWASGNKTIISCGSTGLIGFRTKTTLFSKSSDIAVPVDEWAHVALVSTGAQFKIYISGVGSATAGNISSAPTNFSTANGSIWGQDPELSGTVSTGQMDELRISNIARYTENFTPPTSPFNP